MKPTRAFETDTDFIVCVFESASLSIVTTYDPWNRTHEREGTYSTYKEAVTAAKELVKQYQF